MYVNSIEPTATPEELLVTVQELNHKLAQIKRASRALETLPEGLAQDPIIEAGRQLLRSEERSLTIRYNFYYDQWRLAVYKRDESKDQGTSRGLYPIYIYHNSGAKLGS